LSTFFTNYTFNSNLTPAQRREQVEAQAKALGQLAETIEQLAKAGEKTAMNSAAHKIAAAYEQLVKFDEISLKIYLNFRLELRDKLQQVELIPMASF
jgi:hypothetical protein